MGRKAGSRGGRDTLNNSLYYSRVLLKKRWEKITSSNRILFSQQFMVRTNTLNRQSAPRFRSVPAAAAAGCCCCSAAGSSCP